MKAMNVNTVRLNIDPGAGAAGLAILDLLYQNGIMAAVTVDDAVNDLARVRDAVNALKDHPAVLCWMLGNEWNINRYYGVASSVSDAAQRTQTAALLIKSLDSNHPVAASYGDIDINADGMRLVDTQNYVNNVCTAVDLWALNIYRGQSFGALFSQWQSISAKPMIIGEFGTDAFRSASTSSCPSGVIDEPMQASWNLSLWNDLLRNSFPQNSCGVAAGGFVFELTDEWWKVPPAGSQQTCGYASGANPDGFANEEIFGLLDIDRKPREVYSALTAAFREDYVPQAVPLTVKAASRGANAAQWTGQYGLAEFYVAGSLIYSAYGGGGGARGLNAVVLDSRSGRVLAGPRNFDTFITSNTGSAARDLLAFLQAAPAGAAVMLAGADELGLNPANSCSFLSYAWNQDLIQHLQGAGSARIGEVCFRDSWSMIYIVGGQPLAEALSHTSQADSEVTLTATPSTACVPAKAQITAPSPGSTLSGPSAVFAWTPGQGATAYWLDVGTTAGQGSYFGKNVGLMLSQSVSNLPTDGSALYVRLWTQLAGNWQFSDYTYTAANLAGAKAVIATPAPSTTLPGASATFTWTAGTNATAYWLDVGPAPGNGAYFGQNVGTATSHLVAGLPTNGATIYVRLWTQLSGNWLYNDYSYTAATLGGATKGVITSPSPGSTLSGLPVTFTWTAGTGATAYWLDVGPACGNGSYFGKNVGTMTSQAVTGLPTNGSAICVRLWTLLAGNWQYNDYSYTASGTSSGTKGVITSPTPGTTLIGAAVTFTWSAGTSATAYWLDVGPAPGNGSYFGQNVGTVTTKAVTNIPINGSTVYVRLWTLISGVWQYNDYVYTASGTSSGTKGVITSPTPGTTLTGPSVTFAWSGGTGASAYWLDVGPACGNGSYFGQNVGTATSRAVAGIPTNGSAVCVRLWTQIGGSWQFNDYSYTASH
jgi:hypothetical protein